MTYKEFKETEEFRLADVITFVNLDGEEMDIDDPYAEELDNLNVAWWNISSGILEIVLNKNGG